MLTWANKMKLLWRQGWVEIPELMTSGSVALLGITMSVSGYLIKENTDGWSQKYMLRPLILRPDDPRVNKIQRKSYLDV